MGEIRFDGKNWLARTKPFEEPKIILPDGADKFDFVTESIRKGLGKKGIVAIINARGDNDPHGSDFRYEWLAEQGKDRITEINNCSAFYVPEKNIFVVKGQEVYVRSTEEGEPVASFIFYNLPFEKNIGNKHTIKAIKEAKNLGCIIGLSKIVDRKTLRKIYSPYSLGEFLDFIVVKSGTDKVLGNPRSDEKRLYSVINDKCVGAVSVTGAYDIAKGTRKPFVGRCYTEFLEDIPEDFSKFFDYLKENLKVSTPENTHASKLVNMSMGTEKFVHGLRMAWDKFLGRKFTSKYD